MIIPRPKSFSRSGETLSLKELSFFCTDAERHFIKSYLQHFCDLKIEFAESDKCNTVIKRNGSLPDSGYKIEINTEILIEYGKTDGLRNALATLLQLLHENGDTIFVNKHEINDYSECKFRSVMIDLARGLPDFERLKEDIKRLSLAKCNFLHLHLMDSMGICYESTVFEGEDIRETKRYTKTEMYELVSFCHELGISVIPEIEIPSHATYLLQKHPELRCDCNIANQSLWNICAGNENVYSFYSNLIDEICEIFPDEYIHVGGDELYFSDFPDWNNLCHWDICSVCGKRMKDEGLCGIGELYCYMMNRINEKVKSCGKRMIMWNDETDISKTTSLSRDIIIEYWRIANENRGPRKGCSFNGFLKQGFKTVNANFEMSYIDSEAYANPEKTASYSHTEYPPNDSADNIIGAEVCAWEYGNPACGYYEMSFSPSAILLLDKMWDTKDRVYNKSYRAALTKLILGTEIPADYDMFEIFGSVMPPRTTEKTTYVTLENELTDKETLQKHIDTLRRIQKTYSRKYLDKLLDIAEKEIHSESESKTI